MKGLKWLSSIGERKFNLPDPIKIMLDDQLEKFAKKIDNQLKKIRDDMLYVLHQKFSEKFDLFISSRGNNSNG